MSIPVCAECDRLWDEYKEALFAQVKARIQLGVAAYTLDARSERQLSAEVEILTCRRLELRNEIRKHNRDSHLKDVSCRV